MLLLANCILEPSCATPLSSCFRFLPTENYFATKAMDVCVCYDWFWKMNIFSCVFLYSKSSFMFASIHRIHVRSKFRCTVKNNNFPKIVWPITNSVIFSLMSFSFFFFLQWVNWRASSFTLTQDTWKLCFSAWIRNDHIYILSYSLAKILLIWTIYQSCFGAIVLLQ